MSEEYEVGYGLPPKATRFKKGKSGNPKGRPKGTLNLKTDVLEEANEMLVITENGKPRRISKQRAVVKQIYNKAIKGDIKAAKAAVDLTDRYQDPSDRDNVETKLGQADSLALKKIREKLRPVPPQKPTSKETKKVARHVARPSR